MNGGEAEPYLGFYTQNKISPVHQDVGDLDRHYARRDHLYRYLGIPPFAVGGKSVAEFGPGSGYNALYTTSLNPARYLLVDGNPTGLDEARALLGGYFPTAGCHEFVLSRFQDFHTDERFDLVMCEGAIPHQDDPAGITRHIGGVVKPGGVLVITTGDYVGMLPEVLRRLIRTSLMPPNTPVAEQVAALRPVFEPHLKTLSGMSRPVDDWILDNIVQGWTNPMYPVDRAIRALDGDFLIYGGSPRFLTDGRWYKNIHGAQAQLNERAILQFERFGLSFIDGRLPLFEVDVAVARAVRSWCETVWWAMVDIETKGLDRWAEVAESCGRIADALRAAAPETATGLDEARTYFDRPGARDPRTHFDRFLPLFGQGQQYVSFVKNRG